MNVDKFIFLADFIILDIDEDKDISLILGRLFLATARALIYMQKGQFILRLDYEELMINVFRVFRFQNEPNF